MAAGFPGTWRRAAGAGSYLRPTRRHDVWEVLGVKNEQMTLRSVLAVLVILSAWPARVGAEPLAFEQAANVTGAAGIEVDVNASYYGEADWYSVELPLSIRAGMPYLEGEVTVPFHFQTEAEHSGMADLGVMLKSAFLALPGFTLAAGLDSSLPTGEKDKYLRGGLQLDPFLAADINAQVMIIHANFGYRYYGEYPYGNMQVTVEDSAGNIIAVEDFKVKPGDVLHLALGAELPVGDVVSLHTDLLAARIQDYSFMGRVVTNSAETIFTLAAGVRVHTGPFKALLGVEVPLQDESSYYGSYHDWRLLAGVGVLFGL